MKPLRKRTEISRNIAPAKWGVLAFLVFCLAVLAWDISHNGADGSLTAENAAVSISDGELPEPAVEAEADAETVAHDDAAVTDEALASIFAAYRLDREQSRAEELDLLQTIIEDTAGSETARAEAEQRRLKIAADMENETRSESLLDAKGFGETVVLVGSSQATVVCSIELDALKATQIANIVSETCGVSFENVVIVNR